LLAVGAAYGFGVSPILPLAALGLAATSCAHPPLGLCFAQQAWEE